MTIDEAERSDVFRSFIMKACPPLQKSPVQSLLRHKSGTSERRTYCIFTPGKNLGSRHPTGHGQLKPFIMSIQRIDTPQPRQDRSFFRVYFKRPLCDWCADHSQMRMQVNCRWETQRSHFFVFIFNAHQKYGLFKTHMEMIDSPSPGVIQAPYASTTVKFSA